jgi:hypothetical protein
MNISDLEKKILGDTEKFTKEELTNRSRSAILSQELAIANRYFFIIG